MAEAVLDDVEEMLDHGAHLRERPLDRFRQLAQRLWQGFDNAALDCDVPEKLWGERRGSGTFVAVGNRRGCPMPQPNDLSRSLTALDQDSTLIAVVEMSQSSWLVCGII